MGYGRGAPYWVQKESEAIVWASHESQISRLEAKNKKLEEENTRLRRQLDEASRKYQGCVRRLGE